MTISHSSLLFWATVYTHGQKWITNTWGSAVFEKFILMPTCGHTGAGNQWIAQMISDQIEHVCGTSPLFLEYFVGGVA